jgi:hypothetical protein
MEFHSKYWVLLAAALAALCQHRPASAEDERSVCATIAERAQELRKEHKLRDAQQEFLICAQPNCPNVVRTDCMQWLADVDKAMPTVVIRASGPSSNDMIAVRVRVDGEIWTDKLDGLARPVDPGIHYFRFEADGMSPVEKQIVIREGEHRRMLGVQFNSIPSAPPNSNFSDSSLSGTAKTRRLPVLPFVFGGVGLVTLGSFVYFGLKGRDEAADLASGCGATKTCSDTQIDHVRRKLQLADVSLGVSLLSFGIATWMFVSHERAMVRENATVQISAGPGAGTVRLGLAF